MRDLDELLALAGRPEPPAGLAAIDSAVLAGLGRLRERRAARRALMLACVVAAGMGGAAALVPAEPAVAGTLLGMPASAPSNILAG